MQSRCTWLDFYPLSILQGTCQGLGWPAPPEHAILFKYSHHLVFLDSESLDSTSLLNLASLPGPYAVPWFLVPCLGSGQNDAQGFVQLVVMAAVTTTKGPLCGSP